MRTRKNTLLLTFVLLLSFVLAGCSGNKVPTDTSSTAGERKNEANLSQVEELSSLKSMESSEETQTPEIQTTETGDMFENQGRILIAYFSHTGNTREAAQMIAEYTGGDLAEIKRVEEYSDLQEEAEVEIQDGIRPEITVSVSNVEDYNTVFVGYAGGIIGLN